MVEQCSYCGKVHDVGNGELFGGIPYKTCPEVPPNNPMMFNPRLFKTIYDDAVRRPFGVRAEIKDID